MSFLKLKVFTVILSGTLVTTLSILRPEKYIEPTSFFIPESIYSEISNEQPEKLKNELYSSKIDEGSLTPSPQLNLEDMAFGDYSANQSEKAIYQYIQDHTFRLKLPDGGHGTGFILDFEIPTKQEEYPRNWFIGTNMHVIDSMTFKTNPYNVVLPNKNQNIDNNSYLDILRTDIKVGERVVIENVKKADGTTEPAVVIKDPDPIKTIIQTPELFYHALNFVGPRYNKDNSIINNHDYYRDFAVLKIEFATTAEAKKITGDFYTKYFLNKNENTKPINFFNSELLKPEKPIKDLYENKYFYTGGYSASDKYFSVNFPHWKDEKITTKIQTKLLYPNTLQNDEEMNLLNINWVKNEHNQIIPGHIYSWGDQSDRKIKWAGKEIKKWGYLYALANDPTLSGSSGSIYLDENKNFIGLVTAGSPKKLIGFIEPLMSEGIFKGREILSPKFDLIRGVEGQPMSYKSQLEKYYPNMNTYLKSINWGKTVNPITSESQA